jgi:uncharacterized protein (TIGR03086 family)
VRQELVQELERFDARELHRRALGQADRRVRLIRDDQWDDPTPCTDWDVRELLRHLVSGNAWIPPIFAGRTVGEVGDRFDGDLLGDDPVGAWDRSLREAVEAMDPPDAMDRTVHLSFGDVPGRVYAMERFADVMVHSWDLARALGADEDLPRDLVAAWREYVMPLVPAWRNSGDLGEPVIPPDDFRDDARVTLLGVLGRRGWPGSGIPPSTKPRPPDEA